MSNYLGLVNKVLVKINEPVLTASTFAQDRGIQTLVKNAVNDSIHDIINAEVEWPFNVESGTETLLAGVGTYALPTDFRTMDWDSFFITPLNQVTNGTFASNITGWTNISAGSGASAHTANGNGRLRLTGDGTNVGSATQSLSTVASRTYRATFQFYTGTVSVKIGTTSGASDIYTTSIALDNAGEPQFASFTFTATTAASFITFSNTSTTAIDVDNVVVKEDLNSRPLNFLSLNEYNSIIRSGDNNNNFSMFNYPQFVYETLDGKFGVTPIPNQGNYEVLYSYWSIPADLASATDTTVIPARYHDTITARSRYYALSLRSDPVFADRANREFDKGVERMRTELINSKDYMTGKVLRSYDSIPAFYNEMTTKS